MDLCVTEMLTRNRARPVFGPLVAIATRPYVFVCAMGLFLSLILHEARFAARASDKLTLV